MDQLTTKDGAEVREGLYIQDSQTLYKVSTVYDTYVTVIVCLDAGKLPNRTTVRSQTPGQIASMPTASTAIVNKYHRMLDGK